MVVGQFSEKALQTFVLDNLASLWYHTSDSRGIRGLPGISPGTKRVLGASYPDRFLLAQCA